MKAARRALDLSQEALAFDCSLHRTYVSGVERGIRNPTVTVLDKLAAALKVQPGRLLDEPEEEEVESSAAVRKGTKERKDRKATSLGKPDRSATKTNATD